MAIDLSFFRSETSRRLRAEGHAEGRAEDILLLLERRGIPVSDTERQRITGCGDLPTLRTWFTRAITATSTAEILPHENPTPAAAAGWQTRAAARAAAPESPAGPSGPPPSGQPHPR